MQTISFKVVLFMPLSSKSHLQPTLLPFPTKQKIINSWSITLQFSNFLTFTILM
jgi:hypothetical protein